MYFLLSFARPSSIPFSRLIWTAIYVAAMLLTVQQASAQTKTYVFEGVLPPGASSHPEVEDGETFTATLIVNTSVADTAPTPNAGIYPNACIIGTVRFSGGYLSNLSLTNLDITTNQDFPYSTPIDGLFVDSSNFEVSMLTLNTALFSSDALPTTCISAQSNTGFLNAVAFKMIDSAGSVYYETNQGNVTFRVTDVDTWTDDQGGFFDLGSNWFDGSAPEDCEKAIFNLDAEYDVLWDSVTGDVTNDSLDVRDGNIVFRSTNSSTFLYDINEDFKINGDAIVGLGNGTFSQNMNVGRKLELDDGRLDVALGSTLTIGNLTAMGDNNLAGTLLNAPGGTINGRRLIVADKGIGQHVINNGGMASWNSASIGEDPTALGEISVADSSSDFTTKFGLDIGDGGTGFLTVTNGGTVNTMLAAVGAQGDGVGDVLVSGFGSQWNVETLLDIGFTDNAVGLVRIENGGQIACQGGVRLGVFGTNDNSRLVITGEDSNLYSFSDVIVGNDTGANIEISDGGLLFVDSGELRINHGGTVELEQPGTEAFISAGSGIIVEGNLLLPIGSATLFADVISVNDLGLIESLSGNQTEITGNLVNQGLEFFISGSSSITVNGRVSGTSPIIGTGDLLPLSHIEPGVGSGINSLGDLSVDGNLIMSSTTITNIELANDDTDRILVGTDATIDGDLRVWDIAVDVEPGQNYPVIFVVGTKTGEFDGYPEGSIVATVDGVDLKISYVAGDGNDIALYTEPEVAIVAPESFRVTRGDYTAGGVPELADSDNDDLSARRRTTDFQARVFIEFESTSFTDTPSEIQFTFEASVFARTAITQKLDLFNYQTNAWEQIDLSNAARFNDRTTTVDLAGDLSRFVEPGTGKIESRVRYESTSPRSQFTANIDQVQWTINN